MPCRVHWRRLCPPREARCVGRAELRTQELAASYLCLLFLSQAQAFETLRIQHTRQSWSSQIGLPAHLPTPSPVHSPQVQPLAARPLPLLRLTSSSPDLSTSRSLRLQDSITAPCTRRNFRVFLGAQTSHHFAYTCLHHYLPHLLCYCENLLLCAFYFDTLLFVYLRRNIFVSYKCDIC